MNKVFFILTPLIGFTLGYSLLAKLDDVSYKSKVLAQEDEAQNEIITTSLTSTNVPTDTPTPQPTNTPTPIPSPTKIPTPTPTKVIIAPQDLEPLFDEFSKAFNVDEYKLKKIADCESHFNRAVWKDPYAGMYQFQDTTWTKYRNMMGKDTNINLRFGARESIETAAFVLSIGGEHIWPVCSR